MPEVAINFPDPPPNQKYYCAWCFKFGRQTELVVTATQTQEYYLICPHCKNIVGVAKEPS